MVHRVASVCSRPEARKHVIYQIFSPTEEMSNYYSSHLGHLRKIIGVTPSLRIFLWEIEILSSDLYTYMLDKWQKDPSPCRDEIIRGIYKTELMTFRDRGFEEIV
jgi:hypothetical protein